MPRVPPTIMPIGHRRQADDDRHPGAVDEAGEQVATQAVGAEPVVRAGRAQHVGHVGDVRVLAPAGLRRRRRRTPRPPARRRPSRTPARTVRRSAGGRARSDPGGGASERHPADRCEVVDVRRWLVRSMADPRVEVRVEDVDGEVHDDVGDGDHQDDALHHEQVAAAGWSRRSSRPTPGRAKICSTTTVPPMMAPTWTPTTVSSENDDGRRA